MSNRDNYEGPYFTFTKLKQHVEYKNINTFDDQIYKRVGNELYTKSVYSKQQWSTSSASRSQPNFVPKKTQLTKRVH